MSELRKLISRLILSPEKFAAPKKEKPSISTLIPSKLGSIEISSNFIFSPNNSLDVCLDPKSVVRNKQKE